MALYDPPFSGRLKAFWKQASLSTTEMATRTGVNSQTVQLWEQQDLTPQPDTPLQLVQLDADLLACG